MSSRSSANRDSHPLHSEAQRFFYPLSISLIMHALVLSAQPGILLFPDSAKPERAALDARLRSNPTAITPVESATYTPTTSIRTVPIRRPVPNYAAPVAQPRSNLTREIPSEPNLPAVEAKQAIEPPRTGVDVAGLRQYHLALGQQARQFRQYPDEARSAGRSGRVTMRLAVSETGSPLGIRLLQSSKHPDLDKAALDMMFLAASHTLVPDSLRGQAFSIDLAVDFNPDEATGSAPSTAAQ